MMHTPAALKAFEVKPLGDAMNDRDLSVREIAAEALEVIIK
jgi:hypothetical protein